MPIRAIPLLILNAGLCWYSPASLAADNLLLNPNFAVDVANWIYQGTGDLSWSMLDSNAQAGSGSARMTNVHPGPGQGEVVRQCLPMLPQTVYAFSGRAMVPSGAGQDLGNTCAVGIRFYSDLACIDGIGGPIGLGTGVSQFDTWKSFGPQNFVAPAGTMAVEIRGLLTKFPAGGMALAHYDNFRIESVTLLLNGFE